MFRQQLSLGFVPQQWVQRLQGCVQTCCFWHQSAPPCSIISSHHLPTSIILVQMLTSSCFFGFLHAASPVHPGVNSFHCHGSFYLSGHTNCLFCRTGPVISGRGFVNVKRHDIICTWEIDFKFSSQAFWISQMKKHISSLSLCLSPHPWCPKYVCPSHWSHGEDPYKRLIYVESGSLQWFYADLWLQTINQSVTEHR